MSLRQAYVCMYVCMMYVCMYVIMYVRMYVRTCMYTCVYIYTGIIHNTLSICTSIFLRIGVQKGEEEMSIRGY